MTVIALAPVGLMFDAFGTVWTLDRNRRASPAQFLLYCTKCNNSVNNGSVPMTETETSKNI